MAKRLGTMLRSILFLLAIGCISAKKYAIMAPNVFHIGVTEQVSIAVFDAGNPVNVKLYLQDYPHRRKTFSQVQGRVGQGSNIFLPVKVEPQDLPDINSVNKQYVYLVAKSDDGHFQFHKEAKILLSYRDRMVFIETDKPIYTPRQTVKIRIFPLEFDMRPSTKKITVMVLNPQGIRVQQWKDLDTTTGIITRRLDLDDLGLMGTWTITAVYGHQDIHNSSVQFEVKEYVLPKFSVKLNVPPYILKTDTQIGINITARHVYGKPVIGTAVVYLSMVARNGKNVPFAKHAILLDKSGVTTLTEQLQSIRDLPGNLWFPENSRLQVQADVIARATGNKETAVDKSCQFISSPYLIKFKNTGKYFKPGLRFAAKVVVTYPDKQPAKNVPLLISAHGRKGFVRIQLRIINRYATGFTDEHGEVEFIIDACSNCDSISIQVKTDNVKLGVSQNAFANYLVRPFDAGGGPLIMVRQLTPGKVGRKVFCESYRSVNRGGAKIGLSFAVVSRGRILSHNTTDPFDRMFRSWSFRVTPQMSPSARLIVYYIDNKGRVVADSILLDIEDSLPTEVTFPDAYKILSNGSSVQVNEVQIRPGLPYRLGIKAPQGTRLGLLSVDQSVYQLGNENRFTKERIFKTTEALDLGCGVGGGKNSKDIFKNAGVVLMTENFVSDGREGYGCGGDNSRQKRRAIDDESGDKLS
ncbi:hypothetical protein ABFA07_009760 [Porites harrisoni]